LVKSAGLILTEYGSRLGAVVEVGPVGAGEPADDDEDPPPDPLEPPFEQADSNNTMQVIAADA
jgi:hypothetical protein